eukprot:55108-Eustigmatos_ZCMA.PRE.1
MGQRRFSHNVLCSLAHTQRMRRNPPHMRCVWCVCSGVWFDVRRCGLLRRMGSTSHSHPLTARWVNTRELDIQTLSHDASESIATQPGLHTHPMCSLSSNSLTHFLTASLSQG